MILQGYPIMPLLDRLKANGQVRLKENFTESFLTDLAGNAMALPVVLAIFQAGMAAVGFKACEQAASEDDVRLAMEAVAMICLCCAAGQVYKLRTSQTIRVGG